MDSSSTVSETDYWQDLSRSHKLKKLAQEGLSADCKFVVGPEDETAETIHGHKIFYIMESPVFEKMFTGNFVEALGKSEVRVTDVNPRDFKILSCMIYSNCASNLDAFSVEEICTLYRLCDKYMISSISQLCINHMKSSAYLYGISTDDLITLFEVARDLGNKSLLKSVCMTMQKRWHGITTRRTDILNEEAFYEFVKTLSQGGSLYFGASTAKELHIFSVVNSYFVNNNLLDILNNDTEIDSNIKIENNSEKIKSYESMGNSKNIELTKKKNSIKNLLQNLLKLIDFGEMTVYDFQDGPGKSKLLDAEQKYNFISLIVNKTRPGRNLVTFMFSAED